MGEQVLERLRHGPLLCDGAMGTVLYARASERMTHGRCFDELVLSDETLRRLIHDRAGETALREACARAGVRSLRGDGARWLTDGTTSLAELLRVTGAA